MDNNYTSQLLDFIGSSTSPFTTALAVCAILEENGYVCLDEKQPWTLEPGRKYYVKRNGSSVIAFELPSCKPIGIMASSAHTDSPAYRIKEKTFVRENGYTIMNTEPYGGMICSSWLDRPLSVSGRVYIRTENGISEKAVDIRKPIFVIPSVAIHMNRSVNSSASYNQAVDMRPIYSSDSGKDFQELLADVAGCAVEDIISFDLSLYCIGGTVVGDYIVSPRLDDLQCVFSLLKGLTESGKNDSIKILCAFDNEEVGSGTKQGADSTFLSSTVERVYSSLGIDGNERYSIMSNGLMVSADNAHAIHPNHPEYADKNNHPEINRGIVIKFNASQKYATDGFSAALFRLICERAAAPVQVFSNRSDLAGGSTLGNISSTHFSLPTVDIGLPQLAMHSSCETAGAADTGYLISAMREFYSSSISTDTETKETIVKRG